MTLEAQTIGGLVVPGRGSATTPPLVPSPTSRRREATVVARDPATKTCSINLAGDTTQLDGYKFLPSYVPRVGDTVWVDQLGTDYLIIGGQDTELPKAKLKSTATQTINVVGTFEKFSFNAAGGSTVYDTDNDGTNTMADRTNSRIFCRWPGKYRFGAKIAGAGNGSTTSRYVGAIELNGGTRLVDLTAPSELDGRYTISDERVFAVGDFIELFITNTLGAAVVFGNGTGELGMALWMSYVP